ncbi:hypothetical protein SOVF_037950 [Spinacia oleracea]|nr:hypothetical protein SOVF_037950 [Spinacia oleracea]
MATDAAMVEYEWSSLRKEASYLCLDEDPGKWIQANPSDCLSVRSLELNYLKNVEKIVDPSSIVELSQLIHLRFYDCLSLKYLPNTITSLAKLQSLEIVNCYELQELPPNLGDLESLTHLHLDRCAAIKFLPNSLAKLSKLTGLHLSSCKSLTELPANLKVVNLTIASCGNITCLSEGLSHLQTLCLSFCESLTELPANLNVINLKIMYCSHIMCLPKGLSHLQTLFFEAYYLSKECLVNVKGLVSLRRLTIKNYARTHQSRRSIIDLLENLDELPELFLLNIESTTIKCLPWSITKSPKLRFLFLPMGFILQTLPYHLNDSIIITVNYEHVRKTWKELKTEIGPLVVQVGNREMPMTAAQNTFIPVPGYLRWYGDNADTEQQILHNYDSLMSVKILDLGIALITMELIRFIEELPQLTHLYISDAEFMILIMWITNAEFLQHLPNTIMRMTHLSMQYCHKSPSDVLGKLFNLKSLDLHMSCESELPASMDLPVSLQCLTLQNWKFESLPDSMEKLTNLKALELHYCSDLVSFPANLSLTRIKIVSTTFKSLPIGLCHLEILHEVEGCLEGYYNCHDFKDYLNHLVNLETLSITCCAIKSFPYTTELHNLRELQLRDCFRLKKLPPNLGELINLHTLDISGTRIKTLPDSIVKLPNLKRLVLPKCFIVESLPPNVMFSVDDMDETYYQKMGYYDLETSDEDSEISLQSAEGVVEVISEESEEEINVEQRSPRLLQNQLDATVPGDSNGYKDDLISESSQRPSRDTYKEDNGIVEGASEEGIIAEQQTPHLLQNISSNTAYDRDSHSYYGRIDPIGKDSHHAFCSSEDQLTETFPFGNENCTTHYRFSNSRETGLPGQSSQPSLQIQTANTSLEVEPALAPIYQHDSRYDTGHGIDSLEAEPELAPIYQHDSQCDARNLGDGIDSLEAEPAFAPIYQHDSRRDASNLGGRIESLEVEPARAPIYQNDSRCDARNFVDGIDSLEVEPALAPIYQPDSRCDARNLGEGIESLEVEPALATICHNDSGRDARNLGDGIDNHVQENGQNNENLQTGWDKRNSKKITKEAILNLFPRNITLVSAAKELGVSRSTMKRKLIEFGIKWPSSRHAKKKKSTTKSPSSNNPSQINLEGLDSANQHTLSDQVPSKCNAIDNSTKEVPVMATQLHTDVNQCTLSNTVQESGSSWRFVVKATYKEYPVRFESFCTSVTDLKKEVADNLELELGTFRIQYEDDDKEWMLMTKNKHLEYACNLSKSSGSNILRLLIIDL